MKRINRLFSWILLGCVIAVPLFAQSGRSRTGSFDKPENRSAQALYDDARTYVERKFQEFTDKKVPYDPKVAATIQEEQGELTGKYVKLLESRSTLAGEDLYYLGMLHHLTGNADGALGAMNRFLHGNPVGEKAQVARAVVVLYALKKDLLSQAEDGIRDCFMTGVQTCALPISSRRAHV